MEETVETILKSMSNVKKPQITFMLSLFSVLVVFQGKATFTNLSRYSAMNEKRFRRWSQRVFDSCECNMKLITHTLPEKEERIAAVDASFMSVNAKNEAIKSRV